MNREVPLKQIIEELKKYPDDTKITVTTTTDVKVIGFVLLRKDGAKLISEISIPKSKDKSTPQTR